MLSVFLNGEPVKTAAQTLDALLIERGLADARCATAVNESFVPASQRAKTHLNAGDRIEIVAPRQGG